MRITTMNKDFLVELGTEELPPKALKALSESFRDGIVSPTAHREAETAKAHRG